MIESLTQTPPTNALQGQKNHAPASKNHVFSMVTNERTAGSIPSWHPPKTAKQSIESALGQPGQKSKIHNNALAYTGNIGNDYSPTPPEEEFGFADLVDMVNPLQHIPIVSHIYREITDDEIKPIGKIIGGAVFGGPAGAASGLVNVVIEEETGKDLVGNALALTKGEKEQAFEIKPLSETLPETLPEKEPITTIDIEELKMESAKVQSRENVYDDLPASLLAFADTATPKIDTVSRRTGYIEAAHGRTAGLIRRYS